MARSKGVQRGLIKYAVKIPRWIRLLRLTDLYLWRALRLDELAERCRRRRPVKSVTLKWCALCALCFYSAIPVLPT